MFSMVAPINMEPLKCEAIMNPLYWGLSTKILAKWLLCRDAAEVTNEGARLRDIRFYYYYYYYYFLIYFFYYSFSLLIFLP